MKEFDFDVAVIGGGPGGYVCAIGCAQRGLKTALIEVDRLGGVCLNAGCIPSKTLIHIVETYHRAANMQSMGIVAEGLRLDLAAAVSFKDRVVDRLTKGVAALCKGNGVEVIRGRARFTSPTELEVAGSDGPASVSARRVVLATGSEALEIPGFSFDGETVIDAAGALSLEAVPDRLLVLGGGYIGLELGTMFAKAGSQVTVVELTDQLLPGTEKELVEVVERRLRRLKVKVHLRSRAVSWEKGQGGAAVHVELPDGETDVEADRILLTVGRRPLTSDLNLEATSVRLDSKGYVIHDDSQRTDDPSVLVIGDCAGVPLLAHKASAEGIVAAQIAAGKDRRFDPAVVPAVVFTDPEIANVGLSAAEAAEKGLDVATGRFPFVALGRALSMNERDGFVEVVAEKSGGRLLGARIVGPGAGEMIEEAALALRAGLDLQTLAETVHAHPTLSEALKEAAEAALGSAIHVLNR